MLIAICDNFTPNSLAALKMFRAFVFLFVSLYTGSSFGALHQEHDRKEILTYGFIRDNFTKNAEQDQSFHMDLYNEIYKFIPGDSLKMYIWVGTRLDVEAVLEQTKDYLTTKCSAHIFGDYYQIHGVEIEKKTNFQAEMVFQIHRQKNPTLNNGKLSDGHPVLKDSITIECKLSTISKKLYIKYWVVLRDMFAFGCQCHTFELTVENKSRHIICSELKPMRYYDFQHKTLIFQAHKCEYERDYMGGFCSIL
eukprot:846464_1